MLPSMLGKRLLISLFSICCYEHWRSVRQGGITELKDNVVEGFPISPLWTHGQARG
jgi:hypothetical protein